MRVAVTTTGSIRAGTPEIVATLPQLFVHDGFLIDQRSRILALDPGPVGSRAPSTVILNWQTLLKNPSAR